MKKSKIFDLTFLTKEDVKEDLSMLQDPGFIPDLEHILKLFVGKKVKVTFQEVK